MALGVIAWALRGTSMGSIAYVGSHEKEDNLVESNCSVNKLKSIHVYIHLIDRPHSNYISPTQYPQSA